MKDDFKFGEDYISKGRFDAALDFYLRIYKYKKDNSNINYRIGECYYHIFEKRFESIPYLEEAKKNVTTDYIAGEFENDAAPVEVFLLLGNTYLKKEDLPMAYKNYIEYKNYLNSYDVEKLNNVEKKLQNLATSYQLISQPVSFDNIKEIPNLNTRFSDYHPVISKNELKIAYTSFWESADLIFIMEKKRGKWTTPVDISEQIASNGDTYASSLTNGGKTLYFINRGKFNSDIFACNSLGKKWNYMMPVENKKINSKYNEIDVFVTYDGEEMYFSSDRDNGYGGYDIYKSKKEGTEWGDPVNIGNVINTGLDEENPYVTPDNKYFIFSSEGHKSMGGKDLFFCELKKDGSFSSPINFGNAINTSEDEHQLVYFNETSNAYFAKDTKNPHKRIDIFKLEIDEKILEEAINQNKESIPLASINTDPEYIENLKYALNIDQEEEPSSVADETFAFNENIILPSIETESEPVTEENVQTDLYAEIPVQQESEIEETYDKLYNESINNNTEAYDENTDIETASYSEDRDEEYDEMNSTLYNNDNSLVEVMSPKEYDKIEVPSSDTDQPEFIEVRFDASYRPNPYTVQIMALKKYREPNEFSEFKIIRVFGGPDNYYRYVLDDYWTLEAAKKNLVKAQELGYNGAFIRLVRSIPMKY